MMTKYDGVLTAVLTGQEGDVPTDVWYRPAEFRLEGDALVYDGQLREPVRSGRGMLLHFTKLNTAADIERYASKWGPLGLCHEHPREPVAHLRTSRVQAIRVRKDTLEHEPGCGEFSKAEPVEVWLFYSRWFRGLLHLALKQLQSPGIERLIPANLAELTKGRFPISLDEICAAFPQIAFVAEVEGVRGLRLAPFALTSGLASMVTDMLERTGSRIGLHWYEETPRLVFGSTEPTLLGALALQLAFTIAGEPDTFLCSTCGKPFDPSDQRVRRGLRQYCEECRQAGAPQREAARRYRERKKRSKK